MEAMTVQWQKCNDYPFLGRWCSLDSDILNDPRLVMRLGSDFYGRDVSIGITGVYIIWAGMSNRTILKVGSGIIKNRLRVLINDPKVQAYRSKGLYVTWATIPLFSKLEGKPGDKERGIERFLGVWLNPKFGERFPANVDPIWVNLPAWDPPVNPFLRAMSQSRHTQPNGSLEQLRKKQRKPFL